MRRFCVILGCFVVFSFALCAFAQDKPAKSASNTDKQQIEALLQRYSKAFNAKDVNGIMANYAPGDQLFVFDLVPPRQYVGWDAYKKDFEGLFGAFPGPVSDSISDLDITVVGPVAYSHRIESAEFTGKDGSKLNVVVRVTDVYRKMKGKWLIVQEHVSVPVDVMTGKADLLSKP
jgi:ketosteroid isomerase-like protein